MSVEFYTGGHFPASEVLDSPCPTITVGGNGSGASHNIGVADSELSIDLETGANIRTKRQAPPGAARRVLPRVSGGDKPPYSVPNMAEIRATPWNGFNVASTFSGSGGSSLGYRMAGFRVLWANEFVAAARDTYRANASPRTILDGRDIRDVRPQDVLSDLKMVAGELDLLDGSPPCASFSTAGKRHKAWGTVKTYSDTAQRSDDLFFEYIRLLDGIKPKTFVAENVSGLIKGTAKGYFQEIMRAMKAAGYTVAARLLDAQWLGVPQARQRLIFVGVRTELGLAPAFPAPLPYRYSVRDALPWVVAQACPTGGYGPDGYMRPTTVPSPTIGAGPSSGDGYWPPSKIAVVGTGKGDRSLDDPAPTVLSHGRLHTHSEISITSPLHPVERRKLTIAELRRICAFPDDFELTGSYAQQWERLGRAVPPVMMAAIASTVRDKILVPARG